MVATEVRPCVGAAREMVSGESIKFDAPTIIKWAPGNGVTPTTDSSNITESDSQALFILLIIRTKAPTVRLLSRVLQNRGKRYHQWFVETSRFPFSILSHQLKDYNVRSMLMPPQWLTPSRSEISVMERQTYTRARLTMPLQAV